MEAIREVFAGTEHLRCRFHVLKALFRRLHKAKVWEALVWEKARKLFKSEDKRTVVRRVLKLQAMLEAVGKGSIGQRLKGPFQDEVSARKHVALFRVY